MKFIQIGSFLVLLIARAVAAEWTVGEGVATIQEAVNAASSGDTIRIPAGDYYEQVLIVDKNLTLAGEPGAVIHATRSMTQILLPYGPTTYPLLAMLRSQVVLTGLTFEGERLGDYYPNAFYGLVFRSSGGRVQNCTVRGFRGFFPAGSRAINVNNQVAVSSQAVTVGVFNSTFEDNERSIALFGDDGNTTASLPRTTFTIEGNSFTGLGPDSTIANFGISVFTGAGGEVKANTITGYSYRGVEPGFSSAIQAQDGRPVFRGYFIPVQPVRYVSNRVLSNDHHMLMINANNSQVVSNSFQGTGPGWRRWGGLALSGTNVVVAHNDFSDLPIGIELFGGEAQAGVRLGVAANPQLFTNRFCRVPEPIRAQPLVTGVQEQGTQSCPPSAPRNFHVPADFPTIQAAVNAAISGDTIHIAAGDYPEQIVIANKGRLTFAGEPGAIIHAMEIMIETLRPYNWLSFPVLAIFRSDVVVSNLTFDGGQFGDLYPNLLGIYYLGSGGRVENCTLRGFREPMLTTFTGANALYTDNSVRIGSSTVNLDVLNSTFTDNELSIHLRGDPVNNPAMPRMTFTVQANTVTGFGAIPFAVDGIAIRNGVTGEVQGNTIADHAYTGTGDAFASGIAAHDGRARFRTPFAFAPLLPIRFDGNTFSNNDEHLVLIAANESQVVNNIFEVGGLDQPRWGALAVSGTNILIANNDFSYMETGMLFFANDHFFLGWPAISPAANPTLLDNWFCNVLEPKAFRSSDIVFTEQGTQLCENGPFRPIFQSISASGDSHASLTLRGWHGQPVVIETCADLQSWVPAYTNAMKLPVESILDTASAPRRFYRAVVP